MARDRRKFKKYKKNDTVKAKLLEIDTEKEKIRLGIKQLDKDPFEFFLKKENKDIVTATVKEVLKNGIKVSVGNDKNLILQLRKINLAKEIEDCRPEIFTRGNKVDCMIVDLDKEKRKVSLSIKELEKHNEKIAIEKYGKDGSSSGAVLGDILGKVFKSKKKKEKKISPYGEIGDNFKIIQKNSPKIKKIRFRNNFKYCFRYNNRGY